MDAKTFDKTRLSLFYLAGYLFVGGSGFLVAPGPSLKLFMSNGEYPDFMLRMIGAFMLASLAVFYIVYRDPTLLVLIAIVGLGFILTSTAFISERRNQGV